MGGRNFEAEFSVDLDIHENQTRIWQQSDVTEFHIESVGRIQVPHKTILKLTAEILYEMRIGAIESMSEDEKVENLMRMFER